jgi:hypothetical protein
MNSEPVDIWKRLKKLSRSRLKICGRIRRLNSVVKHRTDQLKLVGKKYALVTGVLNYRRGELEESEIDMLLDLMEAYSSKIERLTEDLHDLQELKPSYFWSSSS